MSKALWENHSTETFEHGWKIIVDDDDDEDAKKLLQNAWKLGIT